LNNKIEIPCAYQGGKQRLAPQIIDIILKQNYINEDTKFYDLCCGSGAISIELINRDTPITDIAMVDASPWGLFYKGVSDLSFSPDVFKIYIDDIPKDITKIKDYAQNLLTIPANEGLFENMVYKFLILQACAFGSTATWVENNKWRKAGGLRNYWLPTETSNRKSPVNPMMPMPNTLFERVENICANMDFVKGIYDKVENVHIEDTKNTIIYIDPPYDKTCKYGYELDYMEYIKQFKNAKVYLSEGKNIHNGILLNSGRAKGGINGSKNKKAIEEWLNVFN
jgi:hypothetical protein